MKKLLFILTISLCIPILATEKNKINDNENEKYGVALTVKNGYFYPQEDVLRDIFDRNGSKGGYWVEGALRYNFWKGLNVEASGSYFKRKGYALCSPCSTTCCDTSCCCTPCWTCTTNSCNNCCSSCECTEVKIPTFGLGLKYFFECTKHIEFFVGAGLRLFFYHEQNYSPYVQQCVDKTVPGGMVNAGIEFNVYKGFFIDIFADYNFGKLNLDCCNNSCYPCTTCDTCCVSNCNPCCSPCSPCCSSCAYDIHVGGFVGGIGIGYKF